MTSIAVKIKGHELNLDLASDSFGRRAVHFKNAVIASLKKLGISESAVEVEIEPIAIRKVPAAVMWFFDGHRLYFSVVAAGRFVDNLHAIAQVIEREVAAVLDGVQTAREFIAKFEESDDVEDERVRARELLGVPPDCKDMGVIDKKYKELSKQLHPDTASGDTEKFKAINNAHKVLKRELQ